MTIPTPSDPAAVAVELERLRGTVETGFARVDGSLALLVQRGDQTDRQLADHETRLDALERARWPLASIAALTALAGVVVALWQLATR
ncbi:hypothetical protein SEA_PAPAYASALAD_23 [Streptomyces phage PapayaSalad]|uniref:Uncharacterized protein n=4 Tax=Austintatiousvirus TaxID=2733169 RepID=A0A411AXH0_9CAUD|nr:hypothetical protein HOR43_gp23 [Streptomyces phage Ididsumtinwong]YP_009788172.1 hypothetical protein HOR44_gp23 [Streptomyces phage PapayaSalad]YP_009819795.1 hypothetical protein HOV10_gp23 [Streptomyces phage Austintatious]APD18720.1 hypothetical protein SEA_BIOSCUM_23 [Streptomyces phage Bioscum]APD18499.1 hypothetical protein SEA_IDIDSUMTINWONG_23 [Streptomyces phage Ididsumtinwong]APD18608.1 hypothetical protein SEA_PAPAYASALAD_23 [Streptomyces phage PapayaSalad]QAX92784.1 hypotheti